MSSQRFDRHGKENFLSLLFFPPGCWWSLADWSEGAPGREDRPAPRGVDGETGTASQLVCQGGSSEQGEQGKLVRVKQWAAWAHQVNHLVLVTWSRYVVI